MWILLSLIWKRISVKDECFFVIGVGVVLGVGIVIFFVLVVIVLDILMMIFSL